MRAIIQQYVWAVHEKKYYVLLFMYNKVHVCVDEYTEWVCMTTRDKNKKKESVSRQMSEVSH